MSTLNTEAELKAIVDVASGDSVQTFLDSANLIVTEDLASSGFSAARLKQIELYLAAHFLTVSVERGGLKAYKIGDTTETYQTQAGEGFATTRYGQQALALDTSGILLGMSTNKPRALFRIVGDRRNNYN